MTTWPLNRLLNMATNAILSLFKVAEVSHADVFSNELQTLSLIAVRYRCQVFLIYNQKSFHKTSPVMIKPYAKYIISVVNVVLVYLPMSYMIGGFTVFNAK